MKDSKGTVNIRFNTIFGADYKCGVPEHNRVGCSGLRCTNGLTLHYTLHVAGAMTQHSYTVTHLVADLGSVGLTWISVLHHLAPVLLPNSNHQPRQNWAKSIQPRSAARWATQ